MVERVGLAAESAKTMSQVAPRLLILAGATGVGKSTAAREIAAASGFSRILSTDAIREIMRTCIDVDEDPALHRSSFLVEKMGNRSSIGNERVNRLNRELRQPLSVLVVKELTS